MRATLLYRRGLVVDYPTDAANKAGSCIFIHVWRRPGERHGRLRHNAGRNASPRCRLLQTGTRPSSQFYQDQHLADLPAACHR